MTSAAIPAVEPQLRPLRSYFLNIAVWSVLAVPVGVGTSVLTLGAVSWCVPELEGRSSAIWPFILIGVGAALPVLAPLVAVFIRGWRRARASGKGRPGAFGVAAGGLSFALFMSALYLAAAAGLAAFLALKV